MPATPKSSESKSTESAQVSSNLALSKPAIKPEFKEFQFPTEAETRLENVWGVFETVSIAPTRIPKKVGEQILVFNDGTFKGVYTYDFVNHEWRHDGLLYRKNAQTSLTVGTIETTVLTVPLPPIGANETIKLQMVTTQSAGTGTVKLKLDGTTVKAVSINSDAFRWDVTITNRNSQSSQYVSVVVIEDDATFQDVFTDTTSFDLSESVDLTITFQDSATTNTALIEFIHIEILS